MEERPKNPVSHLPTSIRVTDVDFYYGSKQTLFDVSLDIPKNQATAFIGPSGCGKSTLLRCFNRMNDRVEGAAVKRGQITVWRVAKIDPAHGRARICFVLQKSAGSAGPGQSFRRIR